MVVLSRLDAGSLSSAFRHRLSCELRLVAAKGCEVVV